MVQNKADICRHWHIQPSEIERMPWWEYEIMLKHINKTAKEENEKQEHPDGSMSKYTPDKMMSNVNKQTSNMMKGMKMPSMPSMPKLGI